MLLVDDDRDDSRDVAEREPGGVSAAQVSVSSTCVGRGAVLSSFI